MKKVIFTVVASLIIATTMMAEEKIEEKVSEAVFTIKINQTSLNRYLELNPDQEEEMRYASRRLSYDLKKAGKQNPVMQGVLLKKAIARNLQVAHRVLTQRQYRDYVTVLNFSMNNRGLVDIMNQADLAEK